MKKRVIVDVIHRHRHYIRLNQDPSRERNCSRFFWYDGHAVIIQLLYLCVLVYLDRLFENRFLVDEWKEWQNS